MIGDAVALFERRWTVIVGRAMRLIVAFYLCAALLSGCRPFSDATASRDLSAEQLQLRGERGGLTYAAFDQERDATGGDDFHGFTCLESCAGHEAGWRWAEEHSIGDAAECDGNSWSFIEGCVAYASAYGAD
jgi:hypothetical protein